MSKETKLVCLTRREFESSKKDITCDKNYLTHYYYKFGDVARVGLVMRS